MEKRIIKIKPVTRGLYLCMLLFFVIAASPLTNSFYLKPIRYLEALIHNLYQPKLNPYKIDATTNAISGKVYEDIDGSASLNGAETGLNGIQVKLYEDTDQNGIISAGDVLTDSVLTSGDGDYNFDLMKVYTGTIDEQINNGINDARDGNEGENKLLLGKDKVIGVKFDNITIPTGAVITNAYLEFEAKSDKDKTPSTVNIYGDDDINPADYLTDDAVASRPQTTATIPWTLGTWVQDQRYNSADITTIIQELYSSYGAYNNGTMAFILDSTGSEEREAKSYETDNSSTTAPRLVINYTIPSNYHYVLKIEETTIPANGSLTTDNIEIAIFTASGQNDASNNFGITLCGPSIVQTTHSTCNDNETFTALDDYFTIAILATDNAGNANQKYEIIYNGTILNIGGTTYGQAFVIGNNKEFSADGTSTYTLTIRDIDNPNCAVNFVSTPVNSCRIDLSLTKAAKDKIVGIGQTAIYTLVLTNNDNITDATNVEVTDLLPNGLTFSFANASQGSYNDTDGKWTVGTVTAGNNVTLTILATVNTSGFINNIAQVTAADQEDIDSSPNNDDGDQSEDDESSALVFEATSCGDGSVIFNPISQCFDNGTPQSTDDYYETTINVDGTGLGSGYSLEGDYGGTNFSLTNQLYNTTIPLGVQVPIGTHIDLVVTDLDVDTCFYARILSTGECSAPFTCWAISDEGNPDVLFKYNSSTNVWTEIGSTTRGGIEALAYDPFNNIIYSASDDQFGSINLTTGAFTEIGTGVGTMSGPNLAHNVDDIDGLTFNPLTGILWASERRETSSTDNDYIFQIDVTTGDFVPDAFGAGVDYIVVQEVFDPVIGSNVYDVDDIAIDPYSGNLYVISNDGGNGGMLTILNKTDGSVMEVIGNFAGTDDMEALGFYNNGLLYGSTGNNAPDLADRNLFFTIDKSTASLSSLTPIDPTNTQKDFEACDCLTGTSSRIEGFVYNDANINTLMENTEGSIAGIIVRLYRDANGDGIYDPSSDFLVDSTATNADGFYDFDIAAIGDFIISVSESTLPTETFLTTDNIETAGFYTLGQTETNNKFGYAFIQYDYGDLPDTGSGTTGINDYETLDVNGGPNHQIIAGLYLGNGVDEDIDGSPDAMAAGDDTNDANDDEDGVTISPSLNISRGSIIRLPLSVVNTSGDTAHIEAWIDWNGDGDFDVVTESIADLTDNQYGSFPDYLAITIPSTAIIETEIGFRIRLSNTDNMTPYGRINAGEVEDYTISVACPTICLPLNAVSKRVSINIASKR